MPNQQGIALFPCALPFGLEVFEKGVQRLPEFAPKLVFPASPQAAGSLPFSLQALGRADRLVPVRGMRQLGRLPDQLQLFLLNFIVVRLHDGVAGFQRSLQPGRHFVSRPRRNLAERAHLAARPGQRPAQFRPIGFPAIGQVLDVRAQRAHLFEVALLNLGSLVQERFGGLERLAPGGIELAPHPRRGGKMLVAGNLLALLQVLPLCLQSLDAIQHRIRMQAC